MVASGAGARESRASLRGLALSVRRAAHLDTQVRVGGRRLERLARAPAPVAWRSHHGARHSAHLEEPRDGERAGAPMHGKRLVRYFEAATAAAWAVVLPVQLGLGGE